MDKLTDSDDCDLGSESCPAETANREVMAEEFPESVKQFLLEHISSVAQLEMLLLLRRRPDHQWTSAEVSKALYTSPDTVAEQLQELHRQRLLAVSESPDVGYRYWPATPDLDAQVNELDTAYRERRVAVITAIYSRPLDKVRTFADAFKLRKDR